MHDAQLSKHRQQRPLQRLRQKQDLQWKITIYVIRDVIVCKRLHFDCLCLYSTRTLREKQTDFSHEKKVISRYKNKRSAVLRYFGVTFGLIGILIRDLTNCCGHFKISCESSLRSKFPLRTKHNLFIEVTQWWGGPSSKIGSGCTPLGSVCPGVKFSPFNRKTFSMGRIRHGSEQETPLMVDVFFFSNIDSGTAVRINWDLNANDFSLQEYWTCLNFGLIW